MGSEDTSPKVRMLLTIGIISVCLLAGSKFVLDSYYVNQIETYEHELLPKTELLDKTRAEQRAALDNGEIPVSVAMQTLAAKGRDNASPFIVPQPSDDIDALKGWAKLKREVNLPPQVSTTTPPPPPVVMMDAGVATSKDGGVGAHIVPRNALKDGGN